VSELNHILIVNDFLIQESEDLASIESAAVSYKASSARVVIKSLTLFNVADKIHWLMINCRLPYVKALEIIIQQGGKKI
jgi:hypothetical protein